MHAAVTFFKGAPVALCPSIPHGGQLPGVSGWPRGSAAHTSPSFGSTAARLASPRASHALTNFFNPLENIFVFWNTMRNENKLQLRI